MGFVEGESLATVVHREGRLHSERAVRSSEPAQIRADRFHLSVGERAPELDGHLLSRTQETSDWNLECLSRGHPGPLREPDLTFDTVDEMLFKKI